MAEELASSSTSMVDGARGDSGLLGSGGKEMSSDEIHSDSSPDSMSSSRVRRWALPSLSGEDCLKSSGSSSSCVPLMPKVSVPFKGGEPNFH